MAIRCPDMLAKTCSGKLLNSEHGSLLEKQISSRKSSKTACLICLRCLGNCYGEFMEKICFKAPRNYAASVWTYNFSMCLCERPKPNISMISGCLRAVGTLICIFEYAKSLSQSTKNKKQFPMILCLEICIWKIENFNFWNQAILDTFQNFGVFNFRGIAA